jgi:monoamine oxidase
MPDDCDVLIIGAGAAGLAAARDLARAGESFLVLEARDRLGGRIHTLRDSASPLPLELGAEFIHGRPEELLQIVRAANLLTCDAEGEHWLLKADHLTPANDLWDQVESVMKKLPRPPAPDTSFETFLESKFPGPKHARRRELATAFVEGFDAAPADRISALALGRAESSSGEQGGSQSLRIVSGFDRIIDHLRDSIGPNQIRLRSPVSRITWSKGKAAAHSAHGVFRARRAIITVPLGVLQAPAGQTGAIEFDPPISSKLDAASQMQMGHVVKILIQFRHRFWEDAKAVPAARGQSLARMAFLHSSKIPCATWWSFFPLRTNLLVGWAGGPSAALLIGRPRHEVLAHALNTLERMTGAKAGRIESLIDKVWHCDWQSDPFSRGAYSYVPVGAIAAPKQLARPVKRTLFFAGEATDFESLGGTVDSAIATARRAAKEVLKSLNE